MLLLNYKLYLFAFFFCFLKKKFQLKILNSYIYNLRINHLKEPFGIDIEDNNFSFMGKGKGPFRAFIVLNNKIIQEKKIKLNESHSFHFEKPLEYNKQYKFVVKSFFGRAVLDFETAIKLNSSFIKPKLKDIFSPIFVKDFEINKQIKKARLYITGLGLYQAFINNKKVGNGFLTPGYNDYNYYLRYQTYNITELLKEKNNNIEIHMGDGWYKGKFGFQTEGTKKNIYGNEYKLCLNIIIEFIDNTIYNISSDETWKVKSSKEVDNSIYDGEIIDYTLPEKPLEEVIISNENYRLIPDFGALIVEKEILYPYLYISPKKEKILDFKQNMVGFVRFKGFLQKNQEIKMRHGEVLQNNCFFNGNYRSAKAILQYKGDGEKRIYEPKFTFFGFRYVLIEGLDKVDPRDFEGVVIYTNLEKTIECKTDNKKINQLIKNSYWGQRGNFLDIPTDCPQRDERFGWTGDSQVFANTACYNMDSYIFYRKYINDLRGDQIMYYGGDIPAFSPALINIAIKGGAVWADAATIIPWNIYLNYGDIKLLNSSYKLMKDYVKTLIRTDIKQGNLNLILYGKTFGDWLAQDGENDQSRHGGTDDGFIMSIYYYHYVELIALSSLELGYNEEYKKYTNLKNNIYKAILKKYFKEDGKFKLKTQTSYVLCLHYNIYINKTMLIEEFKERLKSDLYRIKTGFTGTPLILLTLFDNNMEDIAYRILYNEEFPGWLYAINLGATTIWERWNSLLENGTLSDPNMNSFNHYAFGSVCEAIYSRIAGLRSASPGWKKVIIKPQLNYRMKEMNFSYNSISGEYKIFWKWEGKEFKMNVSIPYGSEAKIILPNGKEYIVNKGIYFYGCELDKNIYNPFSIDTPLIDIIKNEGSSNIIKKLLPKIYNIAKKKDNEILKDSIRTVNLLPEFNYPNDIIKKCNEELSKYNP